METGKEYIQLNKIYCIYYLLFVNLMILGTEINEFVTNRQQSKIHYLSEENKQL